MFNIAAQLLRPDPVTSGDMGQHPLPGDLLLGLVAELFSSRCRRCEKPVNVGIGHVDHEDATPPRSPA